MSIITKPKVILIDIETSPLIGYTWQTYDANVLKILESSKIISVAWKDLYSPETIVKSIADYPNYKKDKIDDEMLVREVWDVLDKADIVIAHYGDAFDLKKLNARFIFHNLSAPSSYETVDTKKVASKYFKFDSNSLNNLGAYLGEGRKVENGGFDLWVRCIAGDMESHPNLNIIAGTDLSCPTCLSTNLNKRGFAITRLSKKQRYQCGDCGSWSSGGYEKTKGVVS